MPSVLTTVATDHVTETFLMWAWEFLLALKTAGHEHTSQKRMQNKTSKKSVDW